MIWSKKNLTAPLLLLVIIAAFFFPVWGRGRLPISADTIVGLYHPYRDLYSPDYPSGVPYKNFLTTDPVRQQFLWKKFAVEQLQSAQLPWWNPYTHSGTPLLANFQAGVFYPLNLVFFLTSFTQAWSIFIILQMVLGGIFFYWYTQNLKIKPSASLLGSLSFIFGGFFLVWLQWGNIGHTFLWLPLILLGIDKLIQKPQKKWWLVVTASLISMFLAGHLQTAFYILVLSTAYSLFRLKGLAKDKRFKRVKLLALSLAVFLVITSVQWIPTLQFIYLSARSVDQAQILTRDDWFIPFKHLAQVVAPDFFGNPATLNYWGTWNYSEFVSYIGLVPLIFALGSLFSRKKSTAKFFSWVLFISLIFALPNFISRLPFIFSFPFLSQAQPSRLISLITFSLSMLAAIGFDRYIGGKKSKVARWIIFIFLALLWLAAFKFVPPQSIITAKRNLIFPSALFGLFIFLTYIPQFIKKDRRKKLLKSIPLILLIVTTFDLFRFATKFTAFSNPDYLFPQTEVTEFLNQQPGHFRIMSTDRRILPPNFTMAHGFQTIEGYDPLYLRSFGETITQLETGEEGEIISFNRIISPGNIKSPLINKFNVKYLLSLNPISDSQFKKVFEEGETKVYENTKVEPRVRLISGEGEVSITKYQPNKIVLSVSLESMAELELADMMYPGWFAEVDGDLVEVKASDLNFRRIMVEPGDHQVIFFYKLYRDS